MATAKIFRNGGRQLVELPPEFPLTGDEVEVLLEGSSLILREPVIDEDDMRPFGLRLIDLIREMPDDMFVDIRDERPPEEREGL